MAPTVQTNAGVVLIVGNVSADVIGLTTQGTYGAWNLYLPYLQQRGTSESKAQIEPHVIHGIHRSNRRMAPIRPKLRI